MALKIPIEPTSPVPIWKQIEDRLRRAIAAGQLASDAALPSVRELAVRLGINPATVSRAYRRLVDAGLLAVRRGEGTFVAPLPHPAIAALRREILEEAADRYVREASELGASLEEATGAVERRWKGETGE